MSLGYYHIFNRGVEKKNIFLDDSDRVRFIHDLYEFNDINPAPEFSRRFEKEEMDLRKKREKLVNILAFCLMPNHYHLLCEELIDKGMSLFMKKIQGGYARAFNEKHKRSGYLFQGRYKRLLIDKESYLFSIACYIHGNSIDLWEYKWKEKGISKEKMEGILHFLENYRWSSHLDYFGKKNFPSVIKSNLLSGVFEEYGGYENVFKGWVDSFEMKKEEIAEYIIE
jgi:putative transposase